MRKGTNPIIKRLWEEQALVVQQLMDSFVRRKPASVHQMLLASKSLSVLLLGCKYALMSLAISNSQKYALS
jgi:hypothetical protein